MRSLRSFGLLVAAVAVAFSAGHWWGRTRPAASQIRAQRPDDTSPVVATYAGGKLTAAQLQRRLVEEGLAATSELEVRRQVARRLVREQLLYAEAIRRGVEQDSEVNRRILQLVTQAFVDKELDAAVKPPTDDELKAHLESRRAMFARPERVRVAHLLLTVKDSSQRAPQFGRATALHAQLTRAMKTDSEAFARAARLHSDDPGSRSFGGELPFLTRQELEARLGAEVATLAFAPGPRGLHPTVVETPSGLHLVHVVDRSAAVEPSVEMLRETLRAEVRRERRQKALEELYARIERDGDVRLDDAAIGAPKLGQR